MITQEQLSSVLTLQDKARQATDKAKIASQEIQALIENGEVVAKGDIMAYLKETTKRKVVSYMQECKNFVGDGFETWKKEKISQLEDEKQIKFILEVKKGA